MKALPQGFCAIQLNISLHILCCVVLEHLDMTVSINIHLLYTRSILANFKKLPVTKRLFAIIYNKYSILVNTGVSLQGYPAITRALHKGISKHIP